jgi:hypothetical protein
MSEGLGGIPEAVRDNYYLSSLLTKSARFVLIGVELRIQ